MIGESKEFRGGAALHVTRQTVVTLTEAAVCGACFGTCCLVAIEAFSRVETGIAAGILVRTVACRAGYGSTFKEAVTGQEANGLESDGQWVFHLRRFRCGC